MKQAKYRTFNYRTKNGIRGTIKAPASKVTEKTALLYADHWLYSQAGLKLADLGDKVVEVIGLFY